MKKLFVLAIVLMMVSAPAFAGINLLINGDFETGPFSDNTNQMNGWTRWSQSSSSASNYNKNATDNGAPVHGGVSAYLASAKTGVGTGIRFANLGCYQTVNVVAGQTYKLDGWLDGFGDTSGITKYIFEVGVIQGAWNQSLVNGASDNINTGSAAITSLSAITAGSPTSYVQVSNNLLSGKSNLIVATGSQLTVYIRAGAIMSNTSNKIRMRADDFTLEQVVPEPGSLVALLTGLVGVGSLIRRRR